MPKLHSLTFLLLCNYGYRNLFIQQRINFSYKILYLVPLILMMYVISMVFSVYSLNFKGKVLKFYH